MPVLDHYLRELRDTHATGENVKETSFYPSLSNLLNSVGALLDPKVHVVTNIRNRGAGLPDGGLFTAKQLREEAREVMQIARRIAAILLLEKALDANYERVKAHCYSWQAKTAED